VEDNLDARGKTDVARTSCSAAINPMRTLGVNKIAVLCHFSFAAQS
jgi:hypothetical protein